MLTRDKNWNQLTDIIEQIPPAILLVAYTPYILHAMKQDP